MDIAEAPTVKSEMQLLLGPTWETFPTWPPDLFAVCAWLLETSGAYVRVLDFWPPDQQSAKQWCEAVEKAGEDLIERWISEQTQGSYQAVERVEFLWQTVLVESFTPLEDIEGNRNLVTALIQLVAIADEAAAGFGVPSDEDADSSQSSDVGLIGRIQIFLTVNRTLTPRFPKTRLYVLPKQHTPQSGITMRSLTHHLALFTGGEVTPAWSVQPHPRGDRLNLLVVPWPFVINPSQFKEANCPNVTYADGFKCFDFEVRPADQLLKTMGLAFSEWLHKLFEHAVELTGEIHGVIFPESSITAEDFKVLDKVALSYGAFVVAGVHSPPGFPCDATPGDDYPASALNQVWMSFGLDDGRHERVVRQGKHHRWQLTRDQIEMYGLGGTLNPQVRWWENVGVNGRDVNFITLHANMTICCLVCEDLARQDPVANLVRTVGPNLVIALLSDGPQLSVRWPARYATVLADDPGSSVLTVTNLGMTTLARPPAGAMASRAVMLWKDARGGLREIPLAPGASGVVLNLWSNCSTEWTADSREDGGVSSTPSLAGIHQVRVDIA